MVQGGGGRGGEVAPSRKPSQAHGCAPGLSDPGGCHQASDSPSDVSGSTQGGVGTADALSAPHQVFRHNCQGLRLGLAGAGVSLGCSEGFPGCTLQLPMEAGPEPRAWGGAQGLSRVHTYGAPGLPLPSPPSQSPPLRSPLPSPLRPLPGEPESLDLTHPSWAAFCDVSGPLPRSAVTCAVLGNSVLSG